MRASINSSCFEVLADIPARVGRAACDVIGRHTAMNRKQAAAAGVDELPAGISAARRGCGGHSLALQVIPRVITLSNAWPASCKRAQRSEEP
jgi:hypothetical protein